ncbi:MAG: hypothetical protein DCC57_22675, partial [Chloroflexi bacterium]
MTDQPSPMRAQPEALFPRRSFLYVPGDSLRKIEKAATLDADTLILDLEDGVARSQKEAARAVVGEALARLDFGARERLVRLNHPAHGLIDAELAATLPAPPHGYVLPKVEAAAELLDLGARLAQAEQLHGLAQGRLTIFAMIETARGVLRLAEIAASTPRLAGLIFGAEDFTADVGAVRSPGGIELLYARSSLVTAAAAYGLHAVDAVYLELDNLAGLGEECALGRGLGFGGKTALGPRAGVWRQDRRASAPTAGDQPGLYSGPRRGGTRPGVGERLCRAPGARGRGLCLCRQDGRPAGDRGGAAAAGAHGADYTFNPDSTTP